MAANRTATEQGAALAADQQQSQAAKLVAELESISPESSSMAQRLAPLMPSIEAKINQGVAHTEIVRILNENGFENLGLETFRRTLGRWRKKNNIRKYASHEKEESQVPVPPVGKPVAIETEPDENPAPPGPSLEEILDSNQRDKQTDKYMTAQRPLIGKGKNK